MVKRVRIKLVVADRFELSEELSERRKEKTNELNFISNRGNG